MAPGHRLQGNGRTWVPPLCLTCVASCTEILYSEKKGLIGLLQLSTKVIKIDINSDFVT